MTLDAAPAVEPATEGEPAMSPEEEACVKIQALTRGRATRRRLRQMTPPEACVIIQKLARGVAARARARHVRLLRDEEWRRQNNPLFLKVVNTSADMIEVEWKMPAQGRRDRRGMVPWRSTDVAPGRFEVWVNGKRLFAPTWDEAVGTHCEVLDAPGAGRGAPAPGAWLIGVVKCGWKITGLPPKSQMRIVVRFIGSASPAERCSSSFRPIDEAEDRRRRTLHQPALQEADAKGKVLTQALLAPQTPWVGKWGAFLTKGEAGGVEGQALCGPMPLLSRWTDPILVWTCGEETGRVLDLRRLLLQADEDDAEEERENERPSSVVSRVPSRITTREQSAADETLNDFNDQRGYPSSSRNASAVIRGSVKTVGHETFFVEDWKSRRVIQAQPVFDAQFEAARARGFSLLSSGRRSTPGASQAHSGSAGTLTVRSPGVANEAPKVAGGIRFFDDGSGGGDGDVAAQASVGGFARRIASRSKSVQILSGVPPLGGRPASPSKVVHSSSMDRMNPPSPLMQYRPGSPLHRPKTPDGMARFSSDQDGSRPGSAAKRVSTGVSRRSAAKSVPSQVLPFKETIAGLLEMGVELPDDQVARMMFEWNGDGAEDGEPPPIDFEGFCFLMDLRKLNAQARNAATARRRTASSGGGSARPASGRPVSGYSDQSGGASTPISDLPDPEVDSEDEDDQAAQELDALEQMLEERQSDTWTLSAMAIGKEAKAVSLTGAINSQGSVVEPEEAEPLLALVARIMLARCDKRLNPDAVPLRALALFLNGVGDAGATVLAGALRGNPSLTQISLKNNCIQDLGLTALGKALEENSVLRILDLSLNNADDKGATALSAMLQVNCALRVLDLDRNTVREAGATALAEGLQKNSSLQVLGLSHNKVSDAGMRALENCFSSTNRTLVELRVQFNPAHAALLHRVLKSVSENVAVPSAIHFPVSPALYGFRNRVRPNKATFLGTPPMKWSVSPPLPKGLLLDIDEGVIEGVPLACAPMVRYTVTARNSSGESQGVLPLEVQALVNQTRRTTIASDAASASYVTSYRFADPLRGKGKLSRALVLEALKGLHADVSNLDGVLAMLEVPFEGPKGAVEVDMHDFCFIAAALLSPTPELLVQPLRRPKPS